MASLRTLPDSKNFIACFTDINGRRRQRSTGTHVRKDAQRVAEQYETAARQLKTEAQIRRVLAELYEGLHGTALASSSPESFLTGWLKRKKAENADATADAYRNTVQRFLTHLGPRAKLDLNHITAADVLSFRDSLVGQLSVASINHAVKIIRIGFNAAQRAGLTQSNPAMQIENLHSKQKHGAGAKASRRPFTMPEIRKILDVADQEWKDLILFGLYTGQRLGDLSTLSWENLDLAQEELRFVSKKTGRNVVLPLPQPLLGVTAKWKKNVGTAPIFPAAAKDVATAKGKVGTLSNQFHDLMVAAGLVPPRPKKSTGKGRSGPRQGTEISYHSLRHTATSLLKNAGVSDVVAREFVGHDSPAVSKLYTHIDTATLRAAAAKMPDLEALS